VPPIPPVGSSLTIPMPLEAYQAISTQQQEALAYQQALIGQNLATLAQLQANFAPPVRRANANLAASA
jgi:hypothetical protein